MFEKAAVDLAGGGAGFSGAWPGDGPWGRALAFFLIQAALLLFQPNGAGAENARGPLLNSGPGSGSGEVRRIFPAIYYTDAIQSSRQGEIFKPYWVASESEAEEEPQPAVQNDSILLNDDVLAFYGHPLSERMGILGRYPIAELDARLSELAAEYREFNGGRGVRRAFYLIYGTVWPQGEIGILRESILMEYIQYALEKDLLIFLDHQIGRYDPIDALKKMLPYLKYPNVHLALDPEWRTTKPMEEIGTVTAGEINQAQQVIQDYLLENRLPGERLLVIHQFNWRMIQDREKVKSDFTRVRLVHCADGFGSPTLKAASYAYNALAANMPIKGFKLFYNFGIPGAGYDDPLLTPKQVLELNPRPAIIMYQ
ncbi:MAG: hypothetical protein LBP71_00255 [Spirochaetaceae bacterium]|jgi:hypothetical protein|nr:hypothetical protein [Spirochaetaceae bacterium]